jgi:hypothetical protein
LGERRGTRSTWRWRIEGGSERLYGLIPERLHHCVPPLPLALSQRNRSDGIRGIAREVVDLLLFAQVWGSE